MKKQLITFTFLQRLSSPGIWILAFLLTGLSPHFSLASGKQSSSSVQDTVFVSGRILDNSDAPMPGVTMTSKGKILGMSNERGQFNIRVSRNTPVIFESIEFTARTRSFSKSESNVTIHLTEIASELSEVVVTALGIKREDKALGYSATTVKGTELIDAISNNWTDALTGKVAGLNLIKSGGGPLGSSDIILRGESSLTGSNSALIVVDGVVVSGSSGQMVGTGNSNYLSSDSPVDFGTGIGDLNPDDIESVTVLKGPGAAALYGSRGAAGAIIITTKSGTSTQKGIGVSVNSNTSMATINRWPDYQYQYGQGVGGGDLYYSYGQSEDGPSTFSTSAAWGPKFDGQMFYQYNPDPEYYRIKSPDRTLWKPYKNNRKDFFQTGITSTNSVAISGGNKKTNARLSYTNTLNKWIIPNMGYSRNNISLSLNHSLTPKLTITSKINYKDQNSDNLPNTGYNNQAVMYFIRGLTPNMDLEWFKPYWRPGREGIAQTKPFSNLLDNPYLQANEVINALKRTGFIGTIDANYQFNDLFSFQVRTSMDFRYDQRVQRRPFDTYKYNYGYYREYNIYTQETNSDFLLNYTNNRGNTIKHGLRLGGSMMNNTYIRDDLRTNKLTYPGVYNFANSAENLTYSPERRKYAVNSLYALANVSYKNFLFLDGTMRADWTSTLASVDKETVDPFFYPSLNASLLINELVALPKQFNFLKLRGSVAGVGGGGTVPYRTSYNYGVATNFTSGLENPTTMPNVNLKPERTTSYEIGTDMRMFKNKFTLDVTLYTEYSKDQIISAPIDPSSGYNYRIMNAGEVNNRGIEVAWSAIPYSKKGFRWKLYGTASSNEGRIISLPNEEKRITLSTVYGSRGAIEAREGGLYGDMYGLGYKRNENGDIIYADGVPLLSDDIIYIGNVNPKYKGSIGTEIKYKNFRLNALFDGQWDGIGFSLTHSVLMEEGKLKKSIPGRYGGITGKGVVDEGDGKYSTNRVISEAQPYYFAHFQRDNLESNSFLTDFIKFREVRLEYTLPKALIKKMNIQSAAIGVYGRDLFVFTKWPAFDPEFGSLTGDGIEKGAEIAQFPSTRNIGINLSFAF